MKHNLFLFALILNVNILYSQTTKIDSTLTFQYLSESDSTFYTKNIKTMIYDEDGYSYSNYYYNWSIESDSWQNFSRREGEVDVNGNSLFRISYYWNSNDNFWEEYSKDEFRYDSNKNKIYEASFTWNPIAGDWVGKSKTENYFDSNSNLISTEIFIWDITLNNWLNNFKEEFAYDTDGNRTLEIVYNWDIGIGDWIIKYKKEYKFDSSGNQILQSLYEIDPNSNMLIGVERYDREFASSGKKTMESRYIWDSVTNDWVGYYKSEFITEPSNHQYPEFTYYWDSELNDWQKSSKYEFSFNSSGFIASSLRYKWNSSTNDWLAADYKNEYTFDENGCEILNLGYYLGYSGWVNSSKYEAVYDSDGKRLLEASYSWDFSLDSWVGVDKWELCYDNNGNVKYVTDYEWDTFLSIWVGTNDKKIEYYDSFGNTIYYASYKWDSNLNDWIGYSKREYTYDAAGSMIITTLSYSWNSTINDWYIRNKSENILDANGKLIFTLVYSWDSDANALRLSQKTYYYYSATSPVDYESLISFSFVIRDNFGVSESEYVQNQAVIDVEIISDIDLNVIQLEAYFDGEIMEISIPEHMDTNGDGLIDKIIAKFPYIISFSSQPFNENQIQKDITASIMSISGEQVDMSIEEIVSIYYSKNSNEQERAFGSNPDYYQFVNDKALTLSELFHEGIVNLNPILMAFKALSSWNGKCYGFSASAGAYFKYPVLKPVPGYPWEWGTDPPNEVTSNIIAYQYSQIGLFPSFENPEIVYDKLKSEISEGNPVIIGMKNSNGDKHAVLATKITEYANSNISTIHIYNTWDTDWLDEIYYDINNEKFKLYSSYSDFCIFPQSAFTFLDPAIIANLYLGQTAAALSEINNKVFAAACPIHMFVEDSYGNRVGILENGDYINEIYGSDFQRIATNKYIGDSITFIYVPADYDYTVKLHSYDTGIARFEYYKPIDNSLMYTSIRDSIELEKETVITFEDINSNIITVDENGDGQNDKSLPMVESPFATKVEPLYHLSSLKIYPNPFSESATIEIPNMIGDFYELIISDLSGKVVRKVSNVRTSKIVLTREGLAKGLYLLEIKGDISYRSKIIIE